MVKWGANPTSSMDPSRPQPSVPSTITPTTTRPRAPTTTIPTTTTGWWPASQFTPLAPWSPTFASGSRGVPVPDPRATVSEPLASVPRVRDGQASTSRWPWAAGLGGGEWCATAWCPWSRSRSPQSMLAVAFGLLHWTAQLGNIVACAVAAGPSFHLNRAGRGVAVAAPICCGRSFRFGRSPSWVWPSPSGRPTSGAPWPAMRPPRTRRPRRSWWPLRCWRSGSSGSGSSPSSTCCSSPSGHSRTLTQPAAWRPGDRPSRRA